MTHSKYETIKAIIIIKSTALHYFTVQDLLAHMPSIMTDQSMQSFRTAFAALVKDKIIGFNTINLDGIVEFYFDITSKKAADQLTELMQVEGVTHELMTCIHNRTIY